MGLLYKFPLVLEPQSEGGYVVTCPLLPELITESETVQEAMQNVNDALQYEQLRFESKRTNTLRPFFTPF